MDKQVKRVTNANFVKDETFKVCCEVSGAEPTKRQASKYRRGIGKAAKVTLSQRNQYLINKRASMFMEVEG